MSRRFPVVTICGSMRFYDQMLVEAERLTTAGRIVLMPFATKDDQPLEAEMLDAMHRDKIDMSDEIIVCTNFSGYVGQSTAGEIEHARSTGKAVTYR